jgi:hypothetical protein
MRVSLSPPRPPPSHMHSGWMVPATKTPTSSATSQDWLSHILLHLHIQSLLTVYVGVVECATASPYTYSSSTHRFPDERTPIEATPLSGTSMELVLGLRKPGEVQEGKVETSRLDEDVAHTHTRTHTHTQTQMLCAKTQLFPCIPARTLDLPA